MTVRRRPRPFSSLTGVVLAVAAVALPFLSPADAAVPTSKLLQL
jgi:hypothetical protein